MIPFQIPAKKEKKGSINKLVTFGDLGLRCRVLILIFQTYDYRKADSRSKRRKGAFFTSALCSGLQVLGVYMLREQMYVTKWYNIFFVGDLDFGC